MWAPSCVLARRSVLRPWWSRAGRRRYAAAPCAPSGTSAGMGRPRVAEMARSSSASAGDHPLVGQHAGRRSVQEARLERRLRLVEARQARCRASPSVIRSRGQKAPPRAAAGGPAPRRRAPRWAASGSRCPAQASAERSSSASTSTCSSVRSRGAAAGRSPSLGASRRRTSRCRAHSKSVVRPSPAARAARSRTSSRGLIGGEGVERRAAPGRAGRAAGRAERCRARGTQADELLGQRRLGRRRRRAGGYGSPGRRRGAGPGRRARAPNGSRAAWATAAGKLGQGGHRRGQVLGAGAAHRRRGREAHRAERGRARGRPRRPRRARSRRRAAEGRRARRPGGAGIRSLRGGWVEKRPAQKPPTPSAKKRCEASEACGVESAEPRPPDLLRARPPGRRGCG